MVSVMDKIIPLWKAFTLQECLQMKGLLNLPSRQREQVALAIYYIYSVLLICRGFFGPSFSSPLVQRLMCYYPNDLQVNKTLQFAASLAATEILTARLWFHWKSKKDEHFIPQLVFILQSVDKVQQRRLVKTAKVAGFYIYISAVAGLGRGVIWSAQHTDPDDLLAYTCQFIWGVSLIIFLRYQAFDLFLIYASAAAINSIIQKRLNVFTSSLHPFNTRQTRKCLVINYLRLVRVIQVSRDLVSCINNLNQAICIPICAVALSMVLDYDEGESGLVHFILVVGGFSYALRGYLLTAYCGLSHSKSLKIYNHLFSIMARFPCSKVDYQLFMSLGSDISGQFNHLVFIDSNDGVINQLDVLTSVLGTIQFLILFIPLKQRLF